MLESAIFPFYFHFGFNNLVPERRKSIWMLLGSDPGPRALPGTILSITPKLC